MFADLHIGKLPHLSQELGSDLFARHVVVEEDARARMPAFAREAEAPLFVAREQHAAADQLVDHGGRAQDHLPHGGLVVLVMAGAHGVFKIAGKVVLPAQHADAALGKEGIALVRFRLCQHDDAPAARQVERTAQPRHARARDEHVAAVYVHSSVLFHCISFMIFGISIICGMNVLASCAAGCPLILRTVARKTRKARLREGSVHRRT